jgi:hypothetical protein
MIRNAPGKALIQVVSGSLQAEDLAAFFAVTYGAFDDLVRALDCEKCFRLLPAAVALAESVPDQLLHSALQLLEDLIPDDAIRPRPLGFSDALLRIRGRAEKLSFLPNLDCAWQSVASKSGCLAPGPGDPLSGCTPEQLAIGDGAWRRFFAFPLPNLEMRSLNQCRADFGQLRALLQKLGDGGSGHRMLAYATQIEATRYWVWRLLVKAGTAHLARMVFLRQPEHGPLRCGHWDIYRQFSPRWSDEEISRELLEIEYYPHDHLRKLDMSPRSSGIDEASR